MPIFTVPDSLSESNDCHDSQTGQFCSGGRRLKYAPIKYPIGSWHRAAPASAPFVPLSREEMAARARAKQKTERKKASADNLRVLRARQSRDWIGAQVYKDRRDSHRGYLSGN